MAIAITALSVVGGLAAIIGLLIFVHNRDQKRNVNKNRNPEISAGSNN